jgi:hypothetical protein
MLDVLLNRLDAMERNLIAMIQARQPEPESEWLDAKTFCRLVSLRDSKALMYELSKGVFDKSAVKNIGSVKCPRYRFHRRRAVDQFLNRSLDTR